MKTHKSVKYEYKRVLMEVIQVLHDFWRYIISEAEKYACYHQQRIYGIEW